MNQQDFIKDNYPEMSAEEKKALAENMNMRYISYTRSPVCIVIGCMCDNGWMGDWGVVDDMAGHPYVHHLPPTTTLLS